MDVKIESSWKSVLADEFDKPYFAQLAAAVRAEYQSQTCYPPARLVFNAFNLCPFDSVKAVILGQDPYHEPGQAHGLSFSVLDGVAFPPSLQNIFKEIHDDTGSAVPVSGNLTRWAEQGVLLLNSTLTVRAHQANSHARLGWQTFTDAAISRCGAVMRAARNTSSTAAATVCWSRCIPRRCRQTGADGLAIIISRAATII